MQTLWKFEIVSSPRNEDISSNVSLYQAPHSVRSFPSYGLSPPLWFIFRLAQAHLPVKDTQSLNFELQNLTKIWEVSKHIYDCMLASPLLTSSEVVSNGSRSRVCLLRLLTKLAYKSGLQLYPDSEFFKVPLQSTHHLSLPCNGCRLCFIRCFCRWNCTSPCHPEYSCSEALTTTVAVFGIQSLNI